MLYEYTKQKSAMSTDNQRKAWNEAMRSAGAVLPASASASEAVSSSRRGVGRKRREKARKPSAYVAGRGGGIGGGGGGEGGGGSSSSLEEREYRVALHMDMLEGAVALDEDDDDEYDEFAELDDDDDDDDEYDDDGGGEGGGGGKGRGKSKKKRRRKAAAGGGASKKASASVPKYLKPRSLASILIEEASRSDSVAQQYVDASVRRLGSGVTREVRRLDAAITTTITNPYPPRKFCPVTGLFGEYTDPRTGIPYATLSALEQIRERLPPWMSSVNAGSASYWEAVKSLQNR
ncbi:hypothetical protein ACHAW5_006282 [Stephanodiscus triporus]|uniref:Vps72/YL1 C-terminal domain-containing protein n=1 Tax=Stephanodiscus triporus TaxID=2934178 RepID=A0ABD3NT46_9STRA